jgi:DNA repair protein RadC
MTRTDYPILWTHRGNMPLGMAPLATHNNNMIPPKICAWAADDRPRERLLDGGTARLSDAEVLAVLLGQGARGLSAVDLARILIERFGGIRATLNASPAELRTIRGVGDAKIATLFAARECGSRYLRERLRPGVTIGSPADSREFLLATLRDRPHEVFCCLFMDNRHRVLAFDELFRGTIDAAAVYPREIVKQALSRNAAAVILAHNHPSGIAEPSQSDQLITRRIRDALELVDIRLLDHFVIGDNCCVSLASRGML